MKEPNSWAKLVRGTNIDTESIGYNGLERMVALILQYSYRSYWGHLGCIYSIRMLL